MYTIQTRRDIYTEDVTIRDNTFSAWMAQNIGASACEVMGVTLQAGAILDFTQLARPDVVWTSPITVRVNNSKVLLIRIQYNKVS